MLCFSFGWLVPRALSGSLRAGRVAAAASGGRLLRTLSTRTGESGHDGTDGSPDFFVPPRLRHRARVIWSHALTRFGLSFANLRNRDSLMQFLRNR